MTDRLMKKQEVEIFEHSPPNAPIIRMPGRQFPGYLIQGDDLNELFKSALELQKRAKGAGSQEQMEMYAHEMVQQLCAMLTYYETALIKHDLKLPYDPPARLRKTMM